MVEFNYDDIVEKLVAKQDISDDDKSFNERLEISLSNWCTMAML